MIKEKIKNFIYFLLNVFVFIKPKDRASILMYHCVGDSNVLFDVKKEDFEWQMGYLKKNKFNVISLTALVEIIKDNKEISKKTIVLTFDDGYEDNYYNVFPVLKKYNFPATIFLSIGFVGKSFKTENMNKESEILNWNQIQEMDKSGLIDFQPHSVMHPKLAEIPLEEAEKEILESKKIIQEKLNKNCSFFAYPYGSYNKEIIRVLKRNGFKAATTIKEGLNCAKRPLFELKRNFIYLSCGKAQFKGKLNYSVSFYNLFKKIL